MKEKFVAAISETEVVGVMGESTHITAQHLMQALKLNFDLSAFAKAAVALGKKYALTAIVYAKNLKIDLPEEGLVPA